jgi:hypothetical protein
MEVLCISVVLSLQDLPSRPSTDIMFRSSNLCFNSFNCLHWNGQFFQILPNDGYSCIQTKESMTFLWDPPPHKQIKEKRD